MNRQWRGTHATSEIKASFMDMVSSMMHYTVTKSVPIVDEDENNLNGDDDNDDDFEDENSLKSV